MNLTKDTRQQINRLAHFIAQQHFEAIRQRLTARAVELRRAGLNEAEAVEQLRRSMADAADL
jgi:type II secretory pathway component HofQ